MSSPDEPTRSVGDVKAHLAECVRQAESGRSIVLTRHGRPVARLVPIEGWVSGVDRPRRASRLEDVGDVCERLTDYETEPTPSLRTEEARRAALQRLLVQEIWPLIPKRLLGRGLSKREREEILGYGEEGS